MAVVQNDMLHFRQFLIFAVAGLLLQACSAVRLGYDNADSLVRWWIDQYVDMSPEQDLLARERLSRFHVWHRRSQLGDYISLARQAQKLIAGQPSASDALTLLESVIQRGRGLAAQATPDIADFLLTLAPGQIERMAGQLEEKNATFAKEVQLADGAGGQRKAHLRRVLERTEFWFGDFGEEQKVRLRQVIDGQPIGTQFWYDERLRRQREWLDLVRLVQRDHPQRERVVQLLHEYAARFDLPADPARLAQAQALRRNAAELFVAIHAVTTPEQRAHAQHKLDDLIGDFTALSAGS